MDADIRTVIAEKGNTENTFVLADDLQVFIDFHTNFSDTPIFESDPTIGSGVNYDYRSNGSLTTGNELPSDGVVGSFNVSNSGDGNAATLSQAVSTDYLILQGVVITSAENNLTVRDGGRIQYGPGTGGDIGSAFDEGGALVAAVVDPVVTNVIIYVAVATTTNDAIWPEDAVVTSLEVDENLTLHGARSAAAVSVDATLNTTAAAFTVTGTLTGTANAVFTTDADGYIAFGGTEAQSFTSAGGTPADVVVNNAAGVSLGASTDLDFASAGDGDGTLVLTAGVLDYQR